MTSATLSASVPESPELLPLLLEPLLLPLLLLPPLLLAPLLLAPLELPPLEELSPPPSSVGAVPVQIASMHCPLMQSLSLMQASPRLRAV
jgi:hypothetical protein